MKKSTRIMIGVLFILIYGCTNSYQISQEQIIPNHNSIESTILKLSTSCDSIDFLTETILTNKSFEQLIIYRDDFIWDLFDSTKSALKTLEFDTEFESFGQYGGYWIIGIQKNKRAEKRSAIGIYFDIYTDSIKIKVVYKTLNQYNIGEMALLKKKVINRIIENFPPTNSSFNIFELIGEDVIDLKILNEKITIQYDSLSSPFKLEIEFYNPTDSIVIVYPPKGRFISSPLINRYDYLLLYKGLSLSLFTKDSNQVYYDDIMFTPAPPDELTTDEETEDYFNSVSYISNQEKKQLIQENSKIIPIILPPNSKSSYDMVFVLKSHGYDWYHGYSLNINKEYYLKLYYNRFSEINKLFDNRWNFNVSNTILVNVK